MDEDNIGLLFKQKKKKKLTKLDPVLSAVTGGIHIPGVTQSTFNATAFSQ